MKTHYAIIYHCVSCGRVVHAEPEAVPPQCCGRAMGNVVESIREGEATGEEAGSRHKTEPPTIKGREKPR